MLWSWRDITFPFFCLPAWWLVGLGIDGLLRWRRLHLAAMITSLVLFLFFAIAFLALRFGSSPDRENDVYLFWGVVVWWGLFAVLPIAWVRQRRSRIAEKSSM